MTITEKILAKAAGKERVVPGDLIEAKVSSLMMHDSNGKIALGFFDSLDAPEIVNIDGVVVVTDHLIPCNDIAAAEVVKGFRQAVRDHKLQHFYDVGRHGIGHQIMPEQGHVLPGTVCVGTDSHSPTYGALGAFGCGISVTDAAVILATGKLWFRVPESLLFEIDGELGDRVMAKDVALHLLAVTRERGQLVYEAAEFTGATVSSMSLDGRISLCNMATELGVKSAIIPADEKVVEHLARRTRKEYEIISSDTDAAYKTTYQLDVSSLPPLVARPHSMYNVCDVKEVAGTKIDQAFLGSCTNGRLEDLEIACDILRGRKVHPSVRLLVVPSSQEVYLEAAKRGWIAELVEAGASVNTPSCAACPGYHTGIIASGEVCISSTNRNSRGRMGSPDAEVYVASPATVAASAVAGVISDPRSI